MDSARIHKYRYITVSDDDKRLGLYLTGAGHSDVPVESEYPLTDHPMHHYFQWSRGRRLSAYQALYITQGKGIFESEVSGKQRISAGDLFILFPNVWHRFSPDWKTGWCEYWVEFNGSIADHFAAQKLLDPKKPVFNIGLNEEIMGSYMDVVNRMKADELSLQFFASASIYKILLHLFAHKQFGAFENSTLEKQIRQAKLMILENTSNAISPEQIAREIGMSYSLFRKEFKHFTGFSPVQYHIQLRVQKAIKLLASTNLSVKEIAHNVGFDSGNYFSRLFRIKTGLSPDEYRFRNKR